MATTTWKDNDGRLWAKIEQPKKYTLVPVKRYERMYISQLEEAVEMKLVHKKNELHGWEADPITESQKKMLRHLGYNSSGILYKGDAAKIINLVKDATFKQNPPILYRIEQINGKAVTKSTQLFDSLTDAEYHAAKHVKPEYDVKIEKFKAKYTFVIEDKNKKLYFSNEKVAEHATKITGKGFQKIVYIK